MTVYAKLALVQKELKAPKNQYNSFGKYKYRSCEDILEAVKPLCAKNNVALIIGDEIITVGERFYIKATARFYDVETGEFATNVALAREEDVKKGMDGSQITGTASSYARKYCLNGLFLIDDTKDADTDENQNERNNRANANNSKKQEAQPQTQEKPQQEAKPLVIQKGGVFEVWVKGKYHSLNSLNTEQLNWISNTKAYAACHDTVCKMLAGMPV